MDDRTFDEQTAREWIASVEDPKGRLRETDIHPRLKAWADRASPDRILEIGAGQGICSEVVGSPGRNYTGAEPSWFLLERARQLYQRDGRHFVQGNAYQLPFPDGAFDAAFSILVWHLLSDVRKAAWEISRVLKAGGHFFVVTANPGADFAWKALYTAGKSDGPRFEGRMVLPGKPTSHDVLYFHPLSMKFSVR